MQITSNTQVVLEGKGPITLTPMSHMATGGEGSIYKASGNVVKLYTDPHKMRDDDMPGKIKLLSQIKHPSIVGPTGLVIDKKQRPIGYYMPLVQGEFLSRIFTSKYRKTEGFSDKHAIQLVGGMRETVEVAHSHKAVMVDANELNWLVKFNGKDKADPRIIDVDSWQIGKWPAKVIMPSIRDFHANAFDEASDWFSWGIVTFQIFSGIHPYRGRLDGYGNYDLEQRMKDNASVFHPNIRLNKAVRDFSCIPGPLLDWYVATFAQGERTKPPSPHETGNTVATAARIVRRVTTSTSGLSYTAVYKPSAQTPVVKLFQCGLALLKSGQIVQLSTGKAIGKVSTTNCHIIPTDGGWFVGEKTQSGFNFFIIHDSSYTTSQLTLNLNVAQLLSTESRMFAISEQAGLCELDVMKMGQKHLLTVGNTWSSRFHATQWYEGVGVEDALGATFLVAPFGEGKSCANIRVRELDGLKVIDAKAGNRFIALVAVDAKGNYQKIELTLDETYTTYQVWQGGNDMPNLNMAIIPKKNGCVTAQILDDGQLTIYVPTNGSLLHVKDKDIATDMLLQHVSGKVAYIKDGNVWQVETT